MDVVDSVAKSFLDLLPPSRRAMLVAIKRHGSASVEQLAQFCDLTNAGARQPLAVLRGQGLVFRTKERARVGRPRDRYSLTPLGELAFPGVGGFVLETFLTALDGEAAEIRERVLSRVKNQVVVSIAPPPGETTNKARISAIMSWLAKEGYMPRLEPDGTSTVISLDNCPMDGVARRRPELCELEWACIADVVAPLLVTRIQHRPTGDVVCAYRLSGDEPHGQHAEREPH